jgi:tRNA threonylcarbamoyladenosine biosynthesis protein TsaB
VRILALDAATEACSVALLDGEHLVVRYQESGRSASEQLIAMVGEVISETGLALSALDAIGASIGPGGFTGVRVTVSVAQGLAFGAGLKTVAVTTLEALAAQVLDRSGRPVLACLDARMNEVYWGVFALGADGTPEALSGPAVSAPQAVRPPFDRLVGIGRGFSAYPQLQTQAAAQVTEQASRALPRAMEIARVAARRFGHGGGQDPAELQPLYVRDKVAFTEAERAAKTP